MDFSKVNQIVIPEGKVIRIQTTQSLLWSKTILPQGYHSLSYIETDGNQHIDTGVSAGNYSAGITYEFRGQVKEFTQTSGNNYIFGCLKNDQRSANVSFNTAANFKSTFVYIGGNSLPIWSSSLPSVGEDFILRIFANSAEPENVTASLNSVSFQRTTNSSSGCSMPAANIYFLWCNGVGETSHRFCGRIYTFSMYTADGVPLRSYIPCRRIADQSIGLYDTVEGKFYQNIGTGAFSASE